MAIFYMLTAYLATALSLVAGAFLGLAVLRAPAELVSSKDIKPELVKNADPAKHVFVEPTRFGQAFRYGPDVNHGRSDTPNNATKQALTETKAVVKIKRKQPYKERLIQDPGVAIGFAPVQSSGH